MLLADVIIDSKPPKQSTYRRRLVKSPESFVSPENYASKVGIELADRRPCVGLFGGTLTVAVGSHLQSLAALVTIVDSVAEESAPVIIPGTTIITSTSGMGGSVQNVGKLPHCFDCGTSSPECSLCLRWTLRSIPVWVRLTWLAQTDILRAGATCET